MLGPDTASALFLCSSGCGRAKHLFLCPSGCGRAKHPVLVPLWVWQGQAPEDSEPGREGQ